MTIKVSGGDIPLGTHLAPLLLASPSLALCSFLTSRSTLPLSFLHRYAALTLTGFIFSFYGLFVTPINYPLTLVNILLFASSAWHLGRKVGVFPE